MQLTTLASSLITSRKAFIADGEKIMKVVVKRFIKRVTFVLLIKVFKRVISATDFKHEVASRIANGAEVTNYNTDKLPREEYMPMMVGC